MNIVDQMAKTWHKARHYGQGGLRNLFPEHYWCGQLPRLLHRYAQLPAVEREALLWRLNYYNKLSEPFSLPTGVDFANPLYPSKKSTAYAMDFTWWMSFFSGRESDAALSYAYLFGDITHVPELPTFVKSRPIAADDSNKNSVLLKLNQIRHYYRVKDHTPFSAKIPCLVWRGKSNHPDRIAVLQEYFNHPLCNLGDTHYAHKRTQYERPFMSVPEQLRYRYVLSIEGYDVATNLKWIMASNSLCFMRKPRYESWFMEGSLQPGVHYVQLQDDYRDIEEKITYYNQHPAEAEAIVRAAQQHSAQFFDEKKELILTLLVMRKYFMHSGQPV